MSDLKLIYLLKEIIKEVGDLKNIKPFDTRDNVFFFDYDNVKYRGEVDIKTMPLGDTRNFKFPNIVKNIQHRIIKNIGFTIEGIGSQAVITDYHIISRIFKTVINILKKYIVDDDSIYCIFAESKLGQIGVNDEQKYVYYNKLLQNQLDNTWRYGEFMYNDKELNHTQKGIFIIKK